MHVEGSRDEEGTRHKGRDETIEGDIGLQHSDQPPSLSARLTATLMHNLSMNSSALTGQFPVRRLLARRQLAESAGDPKVL
jgi:hypothetical protein